MEVNYDTKLDDGKAHIDVFGGAAQRLGKTWPFVMVTPYGHTGKALKPQHMTLDQATEHANNILFAVRDAQIRAAELASANQEKAA